MTNRILTTPTKEPAVATKTIRVPVTITVKDEEASRPERRHPASDRGIEEAIFATKDYPAGTPVTIDAAEADVLLARWANHGAVEIRDGKEIVPPNATAFAMPRVA